MPRLFVYIPFPENMAGEPNRPEISALLRASATELVRVTPDAWHRKEYEFDETIVLYSDSNLVGHNIGVGDQVIVHAHGGSDDSDLSDDDGDRVSSELVIRALEIIGAQAATAVDFAVCYSAMDDHLAHEWRKFVGLGQRVRGSVDVLDGGLVVGLSRSGVPVSTILEGDRLIDV